MVFMGSKRAGLNALRPLVEKLPAGSLRAVICPDDTADPRSVLEDFRAFTAAAGLPLHVVKPAEAVPLLHELAPTTVVGHGWYRIIPVREFPGTEFLGFHYSPLPRYRGSAPLVWQIINGETTLGVSFFVLSEGLDDGDLVDQRTFPLADDEDIADALEKADRLVAEMLEDFVPRWLSGTVPRAAQPPGAPSYGGLRVPEDGRIDWTRPAGAVHDFVRAQAPPYPGAYSLGPAGQELVLLRTAVEERVFFGRPGAVVEVSVDSAVVACGTGAVRVLAVARRDVGPVDVRSVLGSLRIRLA
jgi:methionyl-tRNA formyltransferase